MNARDQRKTNDLNSIYRFRIGAWLLVFWSLFAAWACGNPDVPPPLSAESFVALKQKVAALRGLPFKRDVSYGDGRILSGPTGLPGKDFDDEYDAQSIVWLSQVYKRIGLLSEANDLGKELADFQRLQRLTFYDARGEAIVVAPESWRLARALAGDNARGAESIPLVFALTQALQEQNFQWSSKLNLVPREDRKLAFNSVARGDMVHMGLAYLNGNQPVKWSEQQQAILRLANELDRMASSLPPLLREELVFPYREGSQFVQWAYTARGVEGVNGLFANPPLSSAQIIHPEKFYIQRQNPLRIISWGLARQMSESAVIEQTLGEYLTQLLLASSHSRADAARIASGWTGDQLSVYTEGKNLITCWITAWDNETRAQEFSRAFETVLAGRHRLRFETPDGQKNRLTANLEGGRSVLLQTRASMVLFLDGISSGQASELTERIWQELETTTESPVFPFDFAKNSRQLASRRR